MTSRPRLACLSSALAAALVAFSVAAASLLTAAEKKEAKAVAVKDTRPAKILFGNVTGPAPLAARAIGFYTRGCLAGAVELPKDGPAWQAMRLSRNRNWGHPDLVALVERLAGDARAHDGWPGLLVGDLAQPRGGPMLSGHASHQLGLDADIWLTPMPDRKLSGEERETLQAISVVKSRKEIDAAVWTEAHARLIRRAASYPEVERIFVHPPIKKALCDWAGGKGAWLAKVRAYYGHNYHFHIRIRCPKDSPNCKGQAPARPKDGTGCGEELAYWMSDKPWKPIEVKPVKPAPKPKPKPEITLAQLPSECRAVLDIQ
jgi:penicillin-insensitive murein endopeptidase